MSDWNKDIIDEFRANEGNVGGAFEGRPLLLLHHLGARSGTARVSPLMYQAVGDGYAIFASKAGSHSHPDWFHNISANPNTSIEIGIETLEMTARIAGEEERSVIWTKQKKAYPFFAEYEAKTDRTIPVILLEPLR